MTDTEETERVVMMWPKALKDQVRELAGHRGMTEWTVKAVEKHLQVINTSSYKSAENAGSENEQPSEPATPEAVSVETPQEPAFAKNPKTPKAANKSTKVHSQPEPEGLPHDLSSRDDLFAKLMAKTGGDVDLDSLKKALKPASEIPKPEPKDDTRCPTCGEELIDGECWTCG